MKTSVDKVVDVTRKEGCEACDTGIKELNEATCICPECTRTAVIDLRTKTCHCMKCNKYFDVEEAIEEE